MGPPFEGPFWVGSLPDWTLLDYLNLQIGTLHNLKAPIDQVQSLYHQQNLWKLGIQKCFGQKQLLDSILLELLKVIHQKYMDYEMLKIELKFFSLSFDT